MTSYEEETEIIPEEQILTKRWQKCWKANPKIYRLLKSSSSLEDARKALIYYLEGIERSYWYEDTQVDSWDYILAIEALKCLKNIMSPRNERLASNSSLKFLWQAASRGDSAVDDGFIEEFYHLFRALKGKAEVYPSFIPETDYSAFDHLKGKEAGIARSEYLDGISHTIQQWIKRYPSGLQENIIQKRNESRSRVLNVLAASEEDWLDWRWHFRNIFKDLKGLERIKEIVHLAPGESKGIRLAVENGVAFGITPYYLHLMDRNPNDRDYAIRKQVIPHHDYVRTMIEYKGDLQELDFMRESDTSPIDLITRRYPQVAIIKPYDSCPQICVYCQRNWEITSPMMPSAMAPRKKLDKALEWIANHEELIDILVTGGDPLTMSDSRVEYIIKRLTELSHVQNIRIGTRTPVTVPMRLTPELSEMLGSYNQAGVQTLHIVTHFMHPFEVTPEAVKAVTAIRKQGINVYNQQVFTFANSRRFESVALRIALKKAGVDPYYTFNMKGKEEMIDYAVPIARLLQERKEEARLMPGVFRSDEPVFNVPFLGKNHLRAGQDHKFISILPDGSRLYVFHPWEKNLAKVEPYVYSDVSIYSYLERIEDRGEDPENYRSIWYYY
ncbi:MAG: KamA family radical SAM protein [Candidatus Odinarchaeota archaeon]